MRPRRQPRAHKSPKLDLQRKKEMADEGLSEDARLWPRF